MIGRFLEHSRIFYFRNGGEDEYYIGSADWMYRNLNNRVECITPIKDPSAKARLRESIEVLWNDQRQAWDMQPDGTYVQRQPSPDKPKTAVGTHAAMMERARNESKRD